MASNIVQRVGFAVVAIPLALGLIWLGGLPLALLVSVVGVLGTRELYRFAERQDIQPLVVPGLATAALIPLLVWAAGESVAVRDAISAWWSYAVALWTIAVLMLILVMRGPAERPLAVVAITAFGVLYAAALPAFLLSIRHGGHGTRSWAGAVLVFLPLVVTWICDSAAMFVGKAVGGPKLSPTISPGKTRSGGIGGLVGAVLAAVLWNQFAMAPLGVAIETSEAILFGLVLGVVGQVGDLAESLFKREVGVKDSSGLIPGHGGVLDRFDSLYFILPVAAALLRWFGAA
ncbi:MAG: phosphatidate cytidylyltransferase [Gemmatimonadota bacterium]|mgnify:CR=1 FL=1|nr:phosphatidate cytidylyltransferase [Gemmatimonadota bacterium]